MIGRAFVKTILWIFMNILSSCGLILTNKLIMGPPFHFVYVFTLTSIHFFATALTMEVLAFTKLFTRGGLKWTSSLLMSITCALSVGLMNLSLNINTVSFYQLCKLMGVPWLVFVRRFFYKKHTSCAIKVSLAIILAGVALATVKYVYMTPLGFLVGFAAVVVTIQFQIWQSEKQHEYQLNAMQLNHSQALPTFFICVLLAICIEFNTFYSKRNILLHTWTLTELKLIAFSALLAACVNLCSYGLLGVTSTITFQVVGHVKTLLIFILGHLLYQEQTTINWNNFVGIFIAMLGTTFYGYFCYSETDSCNISELHVQTGNSTSYLSKFMQSIMYLGFKDTSYNESNKYTVLGEHSETLLKKEHVICPRMTESQGGKSGSTSAHTLTVLPGTSTVLLGVRK